MPTATTPGTCSLKGGIHIPPASNRPERGWPHYVTTFGHSVHKGSSATASNTANVPMAHAASIPPLV